MKKQFTAGRRNEIARMLLKDGSVKAVELAKQFDVSTETIRKDIIALEEMGIAQKSYGGAVSVRDLAERPVAEKAVEHQEEKRAIAEAALSLIPGNSSVFLDAGSTTGALADQLTLRDDLIIFTDSISIADRLCTSGSTVYCTGGRIRPTSKAATGDWALEQIRNIHVNIAFIGTDSFGTNNGPTSSAYEESELKKAILQQCSKAILLADGSKFQGNGLFRICTWKDLSAVLTDGSANILNPGKCDEIRKETQILYA